MESLLIITEVGKAPEVLRSIAEAYVAKSASGDNYFNSDLASSDAILKFSKAIEFELSTHVALEEIQSSSSWATLGRLVESRLEPNSRGKTLVDIYAELEKLARAEYHPKVNYHWSAAWRDFLKTGNWLTRPDSLDAVEIVIRMEAVFGIRISDEDAEKMETVAQTVRYLWNKTNSLS
jgi:hypothetical protein